MRFGMNASHIGAVEFGATRIAESPFPVEYARALFGHWINTITGRIHPQGISKSSPLEGCVFACVPRVITRCSYLLKTDKAGKKGFLQQCALRYAMPIGCKLCRSVMIP